MVTLQVMEDRPPGKHVTLGECQAHYSIRPALPCVSGQFWNFPEKHLIQQTADFKHRVSPEDRAHVESVYHTQVLAQISDL